MSKQRIEEEYIECFGVYNVPIYEGERMVGRAILLNTQDLEELALLDVYVYHEEDRRKGYADKVMWFLTHRYDAMITSWLSTAGRDLCLKHGFQMLKSPFKNQPGLLGYRREMPDGSEEGSGKEEGGKEENCIAHPKGRLGSPGDGAGGQSGEDAQEDPQSAEGSQEGEVGRK